MELNMNRDCARAFEKTFDAIQFLTFTALYEEDGLDFDKEKLIRFQKELTDIDKLSRKKENYASLFKKIKTEHGIDCEKMAKDFPYISKMKIAGFNKRKGKAIETVVGCESALEVFFVIFSYELLNGFGYTKDDVMKCYEKIKENAMLYRQGMTNEFVQQFFKEYADLTITM